MTSELTLAFLRSHPAQAAKVLERQPARDVAALFDELPNGLTVNLLQALSPPLAAAILTAMKSQAAMTVMQLMGAQSAALLLRLMPDAKAQVLLEQLPATTALGIQLLLDYPADTVGAWMNPKALTLPVGATVGEALERIRQSELDIDTWLFLVGANQRLAGRVTLVQLLRSDPERPLAQLSRQPVQGIAARASLLTLKGPRHWQPGAAWPVVDSQGRLLGVLNQTGLYHGLHRDIEESEEIAWWSGLEALTETYCATLAKVLESASQTATPGKRR